MGTSLVQDYVCENGVLGSPLRWVGSKLPREDGFIMAAKQKLCSAFWPVNAAAFNELRIGCMTSREAPLAHRQVNEARSPQHHML